MKKLTNSELKEVKGGSCPYVSACPKGLIYGGVCNSGCSLLSSGGSSYSGDGGGGGTYIPPYVPPGS